MSNIRATEHSLQHIQGVLKWGVERWSLSLTNTRENFSLSAGFASVRYYRPCSRSLDFVWCLWYRDGDILIPLFLPPLLPWLLYAPVF